MSPEAPALDETFAAPATAEQIDRAAEALRGRNLVVHVVDTIDEARKLVVDLVPRDQKVFTATSETLRVSGIAAEIDESGEFESVRAQADENLGSDVYNVIRQGSTAEAVVGSVHAVTEDGRLVVASASGSQFAPYAALARTVIWVVGAQKVVPDLETALRRVHDYSLPKEWLRLNELAGQTSFVGKILIVEQEAFPGRGTVVLVREEIGF